MTLPTICGERQIGMLGCRNLQVNAAGGCGVGGKNGAIVPSEYIADNQLVNGSGESGRSGGGRG